MPDTGVFYIRSSNSLCVSDIYYLSNSSSHFIPNKAVQAVSLMLWISKVVCSAHVQGQYKDGTNDTRDFRMVSASFLIIRVLVIFTFFNRNYHTLSLTFQIALFASVACIYAIIRPYKINYMTTVDILILFLVGMLSLTTTNSTTEHFTDLILVSALVLGIPHMVLLLYICYELAKKAGITEYLRRKYKLLKRCVQATRCTSYTEVEAGYDAGSMPDRLVNPGAYEPVVPSTEEHVAAEPTENKDLVDEETRWLTPVYTYGSIK